MSDSTTVMYRRAQGASDAEAIDRIQCDCGAEITARIGNGFWTRRSDVDAVQRRILTRDTFLVFAHGEPEPIASFAVDETMEPFWPSTMWSAPDAKALGLFDIAVVPWCQRQGMGTRIMRHVEHIARDKGCRFVRLDAYEANPRSVGFYRKLGYTERGRLVVGGVPLLCFESEVGN